MNSGKPQVESTLPKLSYEFFPPRTTSAVARMWRAIGLLERLQPAFFSVTYGALGSGQSLSVDTALQINLETEFSTAAHLTCAGQTREHVNSVIEQFKKGGIRHIVALRGDARPVSADDKLPVRTGYNSATEFVARLGEIGGFEISVAAYPEVHPKALDAEQDLDNLKTKLDAGANRAITQFFFDADLFLQFRDRAAAIGIDKPIVPGILPIHDIDSVVSFSQRCGASVPGNLVRKFDKYRGDTAAKHSLALEHSLSLCEHLRREGVSDFHFYTLNQSALCFNISLALGAEITSCGARSQNKAA
jgi:methylenetetrahydrofolate reductase (NADPH)